jgi:hypothetical protein
VPGRWSAVRLGEDRRTRVPGRVSWRSQGGWLRRPGRVPVSWRAAPGAWPRCAQLISAQPERAVSDARGAPEPPEELAAGEARAKGWRQGGRPRLRGAGEGWAPARGRAAVECSRRSRRASGIF